MLTRAGNSVVHFDPHGNPHVNSRVIHQYHIYVHAALTRLLARDPDICVNIALLPALVDFGNDMPVIQIFVNCEHCFRRDADGTIETRLESRSDLENCDVVVEYNHANDHHQRATRCITDPDTRLALVPPLFFDPVFARTTIIAGGVVRAPRTRDILSTFYSLSPRRTDVCTRLQSAFPGRFSNETAVFDHRALCALLSSVKVLVNVRQTDDMCALEEIRILPALLCGCIVVSEPPGAYLDALPYKDFVVWCDPADIPATVTQILADYDRVFADTFFTRTNAAGHTFAQCYDAMRAASDASLARAMRAAESVCAQPTRAPRLALLPHIHRHRFDCGSILVRGALDAPAERDWRALLPRARFVKSATEPGIFAVIDARTSHPAHLRMRDLIDVVYHDNIKLYAIEGMTATPFDFMEPDLQILARNGVLHTHGLSHKAENVPVAVFVRFANLSLTMRPHNYGFFSTCSVFLHSISEFTATYATPPLELVTSDMFAWYRTPFGKTKDTAALFFKPASGLAVVQAAFDATLQDIETKIARFRHWHQFINYANICYAHTTPLVRTFFEPSDAVLDIEREIMRKYALCEDSEKDTARATPLSRVCALFFRGNDKRTETRVPDYDEMIAAARKHAPAANFARVIVQSDETEFIDAACAAFGSRALVFRDEIRHMSRNDFATVDAVDPAKNYLFAQRFLAITRIMSRCGAVVCTTGNCSLWIALFRGTADGITQIF